MYNALIYNFCCFLAVHTPKPFLYFLGRKVALLRYLLLPRLRKTVKANLRTVLQHRQAKEAVPYTEKELEELVKKTFYNFSRYLVDFFSIPEWNAERAKKEVRAENLHILDEALSKGKGVIALTAHIGNWELAGIITSLLGYRVTGISIPYLNPAVTKIYTQRRNIQGVEVIHTGSNPKNILRALKSNRVLAVLGDRIFTEKGAAVKFMGIKTTLPRGPATLAIKTKAPMIAGFLVMEGTGYKLFFQEIPAPPENLTEEEQIKRLMQEGAAIIEKTILTYPDQWLNFSPLR